MTQLVIETYCEDCLQVRLLRSICLSICFKKHSDKDTERLLKGMHTPLVITRLQNYCFFFKKTLTSCEVGDGSKHPDK